MKSLLLIFKISNQRYIRFPALNTPLKNIIKNLPVEYYFFLHKEIEPNWSYPQNCRKHHWSLGSTICFPCLQKLLKAKGGRYFGGNCLNCNLSSLLKRIKYEIRLGEPNRPMSTSPKRVEPILCLGP